MISSFSAAVFVCGGSGITFATSAMQELIQQDMDSQSRIRSIELIWTVQDACEFYPSVMNYGFHHLHSRSCSSTTVV